MSKPLNMETLLLITLAVIGVASVLLLWMNKSNLSGMFRVLFAATLIEWVAGYANEDSQFIFHATVAAIVTGFLIAQFTRHLKWLGAFVALGLSMILFLLIGDKQFAIGETVFAVESKFLLAGSVIASVGGFGVDLLVKALQKWLGDDAAHWKNGIGLLFAGASIYFASLSSEIIGALVVANAFLIQSFYDDSKGGNEGLAALVLSAIPLLAVASGVEVYLLSSDVLFGFFVGAFGARLMHDLWSGKPSPLSLLLAYGLIGATAFGIGYAGGIFEPMGGLDAFLAVMAGAAVTAVVVNANLSSVSLLAPLFALGLVMPSFLENEEQQEAEAKIITMSGGDATDAGAETKGPTLLSLEEISGNYSIKSDASVIQFRLGQKGETKGQFKKVSGSIVIADAIENSHMKVELKLKDFTTFQKMRDEHLMSDEYFNAARYPGMTFVSKGMTKTGENTFEAVGNFTMLGKTNSEKITVQRVELDGKIVLIGSGSIDRTKYGMTPSAQEGNVVDFDYQIELEK